MTADVYELHQLIDNTRPPSTRRTPVILLNLEMDMQGFADAHHLSEGV